MCSPTTSEVEPCASSLFHWPQRIHVAFVSDLFFHIDDDADCGSHRLLRSVFNSVVNKEYLKLCGDGTYRLMHKQWTLLTLGVLTKKYSDDSFKRRAFVTTFNEARDSVQGLDTSWRMPLSCMNLHVCRFAMTLHHHVVQLGWC